MGAERDRVAEFGKLENGLRLAGDWYRWGPYVSERQWGTVREDYSADGDAWNYLPHDHARSQAYRWGEDGLAGFCDIEQRLCLSLALWNGRDPILKERAFGLTGPQGNHGEDVKEYWWYLDAIPSHAWNRWRYHYPHAAYPYQQLIDVNASRSRLEPEYELLDTGVFGDGRYWITEVGYAKASPDDLLMTISVTNAGPDAATLHVLPTAWFRNTWSWGGPDAAEARPVLGAAAGGGVTVSHPFCGELELIAGPGPDGAPPAALFCENETNVARLYGAAPVTPYPKDGINDHVISGSPTVNPERTGTKCAFWYQVTLAGGASAELRLRLRPASGEAAAGALGSEFGQVVARRRGEADEFYDELTPRDASADEAMVMRQAFAGLLWGKQLFYYDVARWLDGDPGQPEPPPERLTGRNSHWRNFDAFDIMSMPDKWEYPWFAAWDLAFHCVALAHVDPAFAKYQLILLCREWFQHPSGTLPAYEWNFSDVNPPVQAWAALEVFAVDEGRDLEFLSRLFDKLLVNFTWWVNLEDAGGRNVYEGGFLGLDNIGPLDRSHLPVGGVLEQSDATGWMGFFAIEMGRIATVLAQSGERPASDLVLKFLEHFAAIRDALDSQGLWDNTDGFYYDRLVTSFRGAGADQGPVDGGHNPAAGRGGGQRRRPPAGSGAGQAVRGPARPREPGRYGRDAQARRAARDGRRAAAPAVAGRPGPADPADEPAVRRGRFPVPARAAVPVGLPPCASLRHRGRGRHGQHRLRARRVHYAPVRRELQLARPGLVPAELPGHRRAGAVPPVLRRRLHRRVPDRVRQAADPGQGGRRPAGPAHLDLHPRARRTAAVLRRDCALAG